MIDVDRFAALPVNQDPLVSDHRPIRVCAVDCWREHHCGGVHVAMKKPKIAVRGLRVGYKVS